MPSVNAKSTTNCTDSFVDRTITLSFPMGCYMVQCPAEQWYLQFVYLAKGETGRQTDETVKGGLDR